MAEVIDWDEAMQQCGDDEEFLRELLGDLREETDSQMAKMEEIIRVSKFDLKHWALNNDVTAQTRYLTFLRSSYLLKSPFLLNLTDNFFLIPIETVFSRLRTYTVGCVITKL